MTSSVVDSIKQVAQGAMKKVVAVAPDRFIPGGTPDPLIARSGGLIGTPLSRLDGPAKVRGQARYAAEVSYTGMLYAALAFSTIARGRIVALDTARAEAAPGVALVMTYKNAPRLKPMPLFMSSEKAIGGDDLPIMQDDRIHWNGQPIALVLAASQEEADHAASLVTASYDREDAVTAFAAGKAAGTAPGVFQGEPLKTEIGEAEAALAKAAHRIDAHYTTPRHNHNAIEPHAATVLWQDGKLMVHDASQGVAHTAWSLAHVFGIEEDKVEVSSPFVGGGFGSKCLWQHQVLGAAAAQLAARPVRIALSREGVYRIIGGRTLTEQRVAIGASPDGHFEALIHTGTVANSRHNNLPEPFILPAKSVYAARTMKLDVEVAKLDMLANTFMRAPGEAVGTFGLECAIDELAHQMGMDPIELRIINEPKEDPTQGLPFSSRHIVDAWRMGAERFGWSRRAPTPGQRREGEWLVGMGCATATYPYYRMPGGRARLIVSQDGHVTVEVAAHEMGMGTATAQTQVIADRLGVGLDQVTFKYGSSRLPGVVLAGGSQQTAAIGAAVMAAMTELKAALIKLAGRDSALCGLSPDEVRGVGGGLGRHDSAAPLETYGAILQRAGQSEVAVEAAAPQPLELAHWSMHSHAAMFCEAHVNTVTGETRIARFLGAFDCGRILNPKTAASQFRGGIIMGLGLALMEHTHVDERNGRIMNPSLAEYHVPVHLDVPAIEVMWTDIADPHTPMGARGVGEIGITGTGAAVANAIFNATGKRVRELPITLDKLL